MRPGPPARAPVLAWMAWIAVALAGFGCANEARISRPEIGLPAQFSPLAAPATAPTSAPTTAAAEAPLMNSDWWTLYGDSTLDAIVSAALRNNTDLRIAVARIDETAAALGLVESARRPGVDLGAGVTRSRISSLNGQPVPPGGPESTTHRVGLSTAFEIDLWGRLRNASESAQQQLLAATFARDTVQLALAAGAAQAYFGLLSLDAQLQVNETLTRVRAETLRLVQRRADAGVASALDTALARTALAATRAQRPELQRRRALLEHQLGQLTGQPGMSVAAAAQSPGVPPSPPAGLPSQLLERRPDVRQAQAQLAAAQLQIEVNRAAAWPSITLTGNLGRQSESLADLLKTGAQVWSIGPALLVSLFDGRRNAARTDQARALAEQAAAGYQRAALGAFRETADALVGVEHGAAQEAEVELQRREAAEAQRIATRRYEAGYSGFLDVLEAQRGVQDAELAWVLARQARLDASVALIKALGGGWSAPR